MPCEREKRVIPEESSASIAHVVPWRAHTSRSIASAASPSARAATIVEKMGETSRIELRLNPPRGPATVARPMPGYFAPNKMQIGAGTLITLLVW